MCSDATDPNIQINRFRSKYQDDILNLILDIQQNEFGIAITADDQPDLNSIPTVYQSGDGNFWVALAGSRIVGTIALIDIGDNHCALRKMFVHRDFRGAKRMVAHKLLETCLTWCRQRGVEQIWLGTTSKYHAAHRFYEKNRFVEISKGELPPSFPVMQVDTKFYKRSMGDG